ncbi:V-type proton ATPase subunit B2 [Tanacetum coccineum]|uniref:V-type proton ATPase subunit B2 n=1 Tax=Tanacetum coccineum TaxID=301880 RepID=A0ABQ5IWU1_9ASTR
MPGNEDKVCKLIKSLYELKQTLKQWYQKFDEVVLSGYLFNQADKCVYSKFDESGKGDLVCLYVDDMLIFGRIAIALQWILDASASLSRKQHALASPWGVLAFPEASSLSSAESALVCFLAQFSFFLLHLLGYPPLESFTMSLEDSGDLDIPDAAPVDPALEAGVLPKFDMHLYRSSLNETHVRYLVKLYGIPEELHPRVAPADVTPTVPLFRVFYKLCKQGHWFSFQNRAGKGCQPCLKDAPTSLKKWKDKFFLVDRRAAPIAMAWRHHDSSVADPFPGSSEYNASDVAKDSEGKVITMAEFLRLPNFKGCKVTAGVLLPPGAARVTHLATPAARLQDIPPKTGEMMVAELPCRRVMDDKEKKKRKAEEKAATKVPADDNQAEAAVAAAARGAGAHKKRRPLEVLANETHVSPPGSVGRMDTLRDQTDEHALSPRAAHAHQLVGGEGGADPSVFEGHGDNQDVLFGPQTRPGPAHPSGHPRIVPEKVALEKFMPEAEASYSVGRFGNLPFTPQWGLTDSSRMDNSRECRNMLANLFTPADEEFFNEGVRDESVIRRSWKILCQSTQQQANVLLRFEALKEHHADLVYAHKSCADVKVRFKECRKELAKKSLQDRLEELEEEKKELRSEKVCYAVEAGQGEIVRQKIINQYLPTFVRQLHQSTEYKRSLGQVFSLAIGKGFIEGISIGRTEEDIQAILTATPNVDPSSSETFLPAYEKLFDQRYSYVDKVARMYLLDPTELQNIMPDETGPTPGGGPRDTPTPS